MYFLIITQYLVCLIALEKLYNLELFKNSFLPEAKNEKKGIKQEGGNANVQMYIDRYTMVEDVVLYYARLRQNLDNLEIWVLIKSGCLDTDTVILGIYMMLQRRAKLGFCKMFITLDLSSQKENFLESQMIVLRILKEEEKSLRDTSMKYLDLNN